MNGGEGIKEDAKAFWVRSRFEFLKSLYYDCDADDASELLLAALDGHRRGTPVTKSDLVLLDRAVTIIKKAGERDRAYSAEESGHQHQPGDEPSTVRRQGWTPPIPSASLKPHVGRKGYEKALEVGNVNRVLDLMSSGRPETQAVEHTSDNIRPDKHPSEGLGLFNQRHAVLPSSQMQGILRHLYRDGGAREFDEGLNAHENKHSNHPHHRDTVFGRHTGNVGLDTLHQRELERLSKSYEKQFGKPMDDPEAMVHAAKTLEWEGYDYRQFLDEEGNFPQSNQELLDLVRDKGLKRDPEKQLGVMGWLGTTEMMAPSMRRNTMKWMADGRPSGSRAKEYFGAEALDMVPFLNRQIAVRLSRLVNKARAGPTSHGNIVNAPEHSGKIVQDIDDADSGQAILDALTNLQVDSKTGEFSHHGTEEPGTHSAYEEILRRSAHEGMDIGSLLIPHFDEEGNRVDYMNEGDKEKDSHSQQEYLSPNHINKYVDNEWLDNSVRHKMFSEGVVGQYENEVKGNQAMRDYLSPLTHGTDTFTHMFDLGGGGMGHHDDSVKYWLDEMYPGMVTQPRSTAYHISMPDIDAGDKDPEEQYEGFSDMFSDFISEDGEVPRSERELREESPGPWGLMEPESGMSASQSVWPTANLDTNTPGFLAQQSDKRVRQQLARGSFSGNTYRSRYPNQMTRTALLGQFARGLDEDDELPNAHRIPTASLANKIASDDFGAVGHAPRVGADEMGVRNERQRAVMLTEAGLRGDDPLDRKIPNDIPASPAQDYMGGLNVYSLNDPFGKQPNFAQLQNLYDGEAEGHEPWNLDFPVFDPSAFYVQGDEGRLTNSSREEVGQFLGSRAAERFGNFTEGQLWGNEANPTGQVKVHGITGTKGPVHDSSKLDPSLFHSINLDDGQKVFVSYENPADLARHYLETLQERYDSLTGTSALLGHSRTMKDEWRGIESAMERQQDIVDDLDKEYYPLSVLDKSKEHNRRMVEDAKHLNNTHGAIAQLLPPLKEFVEKRNPDVFKPEVDEDGMENWNKANVAYMKLCEIAERYTLNHQTPEQNAKFGLKDGIMGVEPLPVVGQPRANHDQDLHDRIADYTSKGNKNVMNLFHEFLDDNSPVFSPDVIPIPTLPGVEKLPDAREIARGVLHHAVGRLRAQKSNPTLAAKEHTQKDWYGAPSRGATNWKNFMEETTDGLTHQDVAKHIRNNPNSIFNSLFDRHPIRQPKLKEGQSIVKEPKINGASRVYKHSATEESKALNAAWRDFNNALHKTGFRFGETPKSLKAIGGGALRADRMTAKKGILKDKNKIFRKLMLPITDEQKQVVSQRQLPLHRSNAGTQTVQPAYTSPAMTRHHGHAIRSPFDITFDHATGQPQFLDLNDLSHGVTQDALAPPLSLIRDTVEPNIEPMHTLGPAAMQSMIRYIDNIGSHSKSWALPHHAKHTAKHHKLRDSDLFQMGEPLQWLTNLNLLYKEDEDRERGETPAIKAAHRIFDLGDLENLRGFSGSWLVNVWPEGERVLIEKKDGESKIKNGVTVSAEALDDLKKVNAKDFVIDCIWDGSALWVVDLLKIATEDVVEEPLKHRMRVLRGTFESTEHVHTPQPVNTRATDDEGLKAAIGELEGDRVMLRDAESTYMEGETRHPKWVLMDDEKRVSVIILGIKGDSHRIGIGPITDNAADSLGNRSETHNKRQYMEVGTATDGSENDHNWEVGDFVVVTVGSATKNERDGTEVYSLNGAKIVGPAESQATDSSESVELLTKSGVPAVPHRVVVEKDTITISLPWSDDEVLYKTTEQGGAWRLSPGQSSQDIGHSVRMSDSLRPCWSPVAVLMLKEKVAVDYDPRPYLHEKKKKEEVVPDPRPEDEKPKKVDKDQLLKDPVVLKALLALEELLVKEKMTWTGPKGLAIGLGSEDAAPRGPTELEKPDTLPDFSPGEDERSKEKSPKSGNKNTITTEEGEKATLSVNDEEAVLELRAD